MRNSSHKRPRRKPPSSSSSSLMESSSSSMVKIDLPTDVLIEILKRLPIKSIIRSLFVSKCWYTLLTSPPFLSTVTTFNLRKLKNSHLFREAIDIHIDSSFTNFTVFNTGTMQRKIEFVCPVGKKHFVVCAVDGLICMFDFYSQYPETSPLILWNPAICKAIQVPVLSGEVSFTFGGFPKLIFGCGFDLSSNEYKVLRVAYFNSVFEGGLIYTKFRVDVYSVWSGEWRSKENSVALDIVTIRWRGTFLKGVIHWICNVSVNVDSYNVIRRSILTFKLSNEKFGEIKLPNELVDPTNQTLRVVTVPRGDKVVLGVIHIVQTNLNLWAMDDYGENESWVMLFNVNLEDDIKNDLKVAVLSDRFALVHTLLRGWVFYDDNVEVLRFARGLTRDLDYVDSYAESLILLGQRKGVVSYDGIPQPCRMELQQPKPNRRGGRGNRGRVRR